jgi:hypothetical protein
MREFVTAVSEEFSEVEADKGEVITLDGEELRYYRPAEGQYMVFMASTGRHSTTQDQIAAVTNFFVDLFDKESQAYLVGRLLDRDDPFGIETINKIMDAMAEEWGGRPTKSSTGSTSSRRTGGRKSTAPTRTSTSSASPSTDS